MENSYINGLLSKAQKFLQSGLTKSTKATYRAGYRNYLKFCRTAGRQPVPTSECTLSLFSTYLATHNISITTIKVYLSAVRYIHLCRGLHNHFKRQFTPRLNLILRGIRKRQACTRPTRQRLPVTIQILCKLKKLLIKRNPSYDAITLWAMCCTAFFGFLRVSEFTIPTPGSYDHSRHLSLEDIAVDDKNNPRLIQLFLKQSKTDPFKQGATVYLGATDSSVCPIKAVTCYLARRKSQPGPLFITKKGNGWTSHMFCKALKCVFAQMKLDKQLYNTHSFRIGAATSASLANLSDTQIQMLGRWRSNAFQRYIRPPPKKVAAFSKALIVSKQGVTECS